MADYGIDPDTLLDGLTSEWRYLKATKDERAKDVEAEIKRLGFKVPSAGARETTSQPPAAS